ncbi:hypothetical protein [Geodermatophilus sp. SYSU D01105]
MATLTLTAACGGESAAVESAEPESSATTTPPPAPGTVLASFAGLELYEDYETDDQTSGLALVMPDDGELEEGQLLNSDGELLPLPVGDFSELDGVRVVAPDLLLVQGKPNGRDYDLYALTPNGEEVYSLPIDWEGGNYTATDDYVTVSSTYNSTGCDSRAVYEIPTGTPVSWSWPADLAGTCVLDQRGNYVAVGDPGRESRGEKPQTWAVLDLQTGQRASTDVLEPTNPVPDGAMVHSGDFAYVLSNELRYDDGQTSWTLGGLPDDANYRGGEFERLAVEHDSDGLMFTVVDAATGDVVSTVDTKAATGADRCRFSGFLAEDRMLVDCSHSDDDDYGNLYILAV